MTVEDRWARVERLILLHTMPAAKDDQVAAARDLALEVLEQAASYSQDGLLYVLRARIAALPDRAGEGSE